MWSNKKLLVLASFLIIFSGLGLFWFGFQPQQTSVVVPSATATITPSVSPIATSSAFDSQGFTPGESKPTPGVFIQGVEGEQAYVVKVTDGDTIEVLLAGEQKIVRLIGIDTPETVDPRRPVGCFGKEAANETKSLLSDRGVILQKDVSDTDKYKRLLRYVFLPLDNNQTLFVNDYLVREGFAKVLTYPPDVKFNDQFRQAETEARENNRGLWVRCR